MDNVFEFRVFGDEFVYHDGNAVVDGLIDHVESCYTIRNAHNCTYRDFQLIDGLFQYYFGHTI